MVVVWLLLFVVCWLCVILRSVLLIVCCLMCAVVLEFAVCCLPFGVFAAVGQLLTVERCLLRVVCCVSLAGCCLFFVVVLVVACSL